VQIVVRRVRVDHPGLPARRNAIEAQQGHQQQRLLAAVGMAGSQRVFADVADRRVFERPGPGNVIDPPRQSVWSYARKLGGLPLPIPYLPWRSFAALAFGGCGKHANGGFTRGFTEAFRGHRVPTLARTSQARLRFASPHAIVVGPSCIGLWRQPVPALRWQLQNLLRAGWGTTGGSLTKRSSSAGNRARRKTVSEPG